jgi:hypothetical protein
MSNDSTANGAAAAGDRLAADYAAVALAVTGAGDVLDGFDAARVAVTRDALMNKRVRAVARAWPGLARELGDEFSARFAAFARSTPLPSSGGPLADGRAFAQTLEQRGELRDAGRREALAVDLRYRAVPGGLTPRGRGLVVRTTLLRSPRRLLIAVRFPSTRESWFALPVRSGG